MAEPLAHVWQPGRIGPLALPHRIVMGSMHLGLEGIDPDGIRTAAFYRARAEGGAALIVTGGSAVSRVGAAGRNYSFINDDAEADKLAAVAQAAHAGGAQILLQLFHAGRYAHQTAFGLQPVAPSAVYSALVKAEPRALSEEEILETIEDFASGAERARELGFDGVEIMGSEGYLLNQFMAPLTNLRDDAWGGDSQRRRRFPLAVAAAVRTAAGPDQAVVFRISGADLISGGATQEEVNSLARELADGSVDALNVGIGWHEAKVPTVQAAVPHGAWTAWARRIREAVPADVAVLTSNRINTIELADEVLARGDADFISMARPFLADPDLIASSRPGSERRVNVCIACNACIALSIVDKPVSCVVNPRAGHESEPLVAAVRDAPVAVIGGGPAGLEAARTLALAGYRVTLFEAAGELGGQFRMARQIPGKQDFDKTIGYFERELSRLSVDVRLAAPVDDVEALREFDAVVVATGVLPRAVALEGVDLPHVRTYAEVLLADAPAGAVGEGDVAVIGGGGIGTDIAHLLSEAALGEFHVRYELSDGELPSPPARQLTVMRRAGRIGDGVSPVSRWVVVQELQMAGAELLTDVEYERIGPESISIRTAEGELREIPAQTVVIAAGQEPNATLVPKLDAAGIPHVVIGGAANAVRLDAGRAFREGAEAAGAVNELLAPSAAAPSA